MRSLGGMLGWLAVVVCLPAAAGNQLQDVRVWAGPERTRVVFDLTQNFSHESFRLDNPRRLVIDIPDVVRAAALGENFAGHGLVERVRTGIHDGDDLRMVLDLFQPVATHMFTLKPNGDYGYRLVVDLEAPGAKAEQLPPKAVAPAATAPPRRELVVAIDAGHGGEDPGAIGPDGVYEKDVVLDIARHLKRLVDAQPGMRAVLTRDGDYFLTLRERIGKAREAKADLFVSIHANAARSPYASGSSVYVLSLDGASSEHARWLAHRENASDLMGGVSLENKDKALASFLLDLSQGASIEASLDVGARVLAQLDDINDLHKQKVQQAAFVVLKSPDIPSILVETAFVSNPDEEEQLTSTGFQQELAQAILQGVEGYFASYRPAGAPVVARVESYEVQPGDTLSGIAMLYGVSVAHLRQANDLDGNVIRVGQTLQIPLARIAASGS